MTTDLLTVTHLAARLNVRERIILALVEQGNIPYLKIGKAIRFQWEAVEVWLDAKTHPATFRQIPPRTKGISTLPHDTNESPVRLVRGQRGTNRARLKSQQA